VITTTAPTSPGHAAPVATRTDRARLAQLCKALGDDTRLRVIDLLTAGERCVCEPQESVRIAQPLLSFHLRVLRDAGVVSHRREGRWAYYSLRADAMAELGATVEALHERAQEAQPTQCCAEIVPLETR
jgi:ArsR family transcriptional regulator